MKKNGKKKKKKKKRKKKRKEHLRSGRLRKQTSRRKMG